MDAEAEAAPPAWLRSTWVGLREPLSTTTKTNPEAASGALLDRGRKALAAVGRVEWGLVIALALALFASVPFLTRVGLPHDTDAELHVYRTAELSRIAREGVLYPRWASNLYLGYGYPIFHYYAPLTYHLGSWVASLVPGASAVAGTKMVFVLGLFLASVGAYCLARDLFGPAGGVLTAAAFTLSPYVLFIDPHGRGDLAEHFAICLLPLAFYFVRRLMIAPGPGALLGTVVSLAAVVFSHNLTGLVAGILILAYWAWKMISGRKRSRFVWAPVAFMLAVGLIAFFWLPALVEYDAVKLEVTGPGHFDFREHFLSLRELLAPSRLVDWGASGPRFRHNLGTVQWILALPAAAVIVRSAERRGRGGGSSDIGYFVAGALGLVLLMLPPSMPLWETIPVMPYLQFPWRLLGPASLMLAVCAGSSVTLLPQTHWRRAVLAGGVALCLVGALPLLYPPPWPADFGATTPSAILQWERESQAFGTTSTGDFLPTIVEMIPSPAETLIESFEGAGLIDKVNRATVPDDAQVAIVSHGPNHDRFRVLASQPFVLRLYTFHFPGWRAYIDGQETEIELARPEGFITVPVPEGEHTVLVRFEDTPVRTVGWVVSAGALLMLIAIVLVMGRAGPCEADEPSSRLAPGDALPLGGVLVLALLLRVGPVDTEGFLYLDSPPGRALPAQNQQQQNFEDKIELLGYDLPRRQVRPGETVSVVLYWRALTPLEENYQSFVHIAEPLHTVWGQEDHLNPGGLPTARWSVGEYVWDEYEIRVRRETPPGDYRVNVGLYRRAEDYRLRLYDEDGQPQGDSLVIGTIEVVE